MIEYDMHFSIHLHFKVLMKAYCQGMPRPLCIFPLQCCDKILLHVASKKTFCIKCKVNMQEWNWTSSFSVSAPYWKSSGSLLQRQKNICLNFLWSRLLSDFQTQVIRKFPLSSRKLQSKDPQALPETLSTK